MKTEEEFKAEIKIILDYFGTIQSQLGGCKGRQMRQIVADARLKVAKQYGLTDYTG